MLALALLLSTLAAGQSATSSPRSASMQEQLGVAIPMRDGVYLAADVFLPRRDGRWPTVLVRTPYNRKAPSVSSYLFFVNRGYAVLIEDVRGRYASKGNFGPASQEGPDGYDTINWIARQAWSNGRVAMAGSSYLGIANWWAAIEDNPHLAAISAMNSGDDEYLDRFYSTGGALQAAHRLRWLVQNLIPPPQVRPLFDTYIRHLPLRTADLAATGVILPRWRTAIDHPSYDQYWKSLSIREHLGSVNIPVQSFGGWFDNYAESDLDAFSQLSRGHGTIETWIGPSAHSSASKFPTRDFGSQAITGIRSKQADWFDRWLKKTPGSAPSGPPTSLLHIFVMGPNVWREEHEWPLLRTHYTPLYLTSSGHANSLSGDGELRWEPVWEKAEPDAFTYDPKDPAPTIGGALCCDAKLLPPGPLDQTPVELRQDVLVYTSAPLPENLEVTGPVRAVLYIATSVNDTDFTAKLVDVQRNGQPLLVTDGIQRLRYRLSLDKPVFVKRNTAYQISIDAGVTSYVFPAGHRIRIEVSSSNFPRFDRNLNSSRPNGDETKMTKARQTVFHEKGYPSAVILPLIFDKGRHSRSSTEPRLSGSGI
ncbi:MAG: CocE/NonD family hydrolase [Acidobacteriaceae bacterium]|nr:CocE/NonD family hydrolase [Acidobacteriaceae bacterium]